VIWLGQGVGEALGRGERLRTAAAIQEVFRRGRRVEQPSFVVLWRIGQTTGGVAFAVSRKTGTAVRRNRARRRIREAYRRQGTRLPEGVSVVFVTRPRLLETGFSELAVEMRIALAAVARHAEAALAGARS
jgi:ribonuclease P protein component